MHSRQPSFNGIFETLETHKQTKATTREISSQTQTSEVDEYFMKYGKAAYEKLISQILKGDLICKCCRKEKDLSEFL